MPLQQLAILLRIRQALITAIGCLIAIGCDSGTTLETSASSEKSGALRQEQESVVLFERAASQEDWQRVDTAKLTRVEFLDDDQGPIDLTSLVDATDLRRFRFDGPFDPAQIQSLESAAGLELLNIPNTTGTPELSSRIHALKNLRSLRIGGPGVGDLLRDGAANWPELTHVHLLNTSVSEAGLANLSEVESLESFYVDNVQLSENAMSDFANRRPDVHIHINQLHPGESQ